MRALLTVFVCLLFAGSVYAQNHQGAYIAFDRETHEYGEISADNVPDGKVSFKVYNQGNQPLVLSTVRACCGTRVEGYTREPIAPSDSGYVEVQFRVVPQPHRIRRTITIQSNAANRQTAILRVQGEVVEPKGDITLKEE
jgi:hypothetical protein